MSEKWEVEPEFLKKILKQIGDSVKTVKKMESKVLEHDRFIQEFKLEKELKDIQKNNPTGQMIRSIGNDNTVKMEVLFSGVVTDEEVNRKGMDFQIELQGLLNKYLVKKLKVDVEI